MPKEIKAQKSTDPKSFVPKNVVPPNPERINMTKVEAIKDSERLKERDARKEKAGKAFDVEETTKAKKDKGKK